MGLNVKIKGLTYKETYNGSYVYYWKYRHEVAIAYNKRLGEIFKQSLYRQLTKEEIEEWNKICNDDLDLFLWHSDCDGKFTPKECKKIYNVLKDLDLKDFTEIHNLWLNMFKYCYKHRVNMWYY